MQSIVSYLVRGEGGSARWRGNVAPQLIADLIDQFHPASVADPMMGSGTTPDVCKKLNVKCWATDLHQGFDIQKGELPVGFEMWFYHPPYWDIIPYSGNMWASKPDPRDGSHIQNYSQFIAWANENMYRMYEALPQGGLIAEQNRLTGAPSSTGSCKPMPALSRWSMVSGSQQDIQQQKTISVALWRHGKERLTRWLINKQKTN